MANNHTTCAKHNSIELTGNLFVHHPVASAPRVFEEDIATLYLDLLDPTNPWADHLIDARQ